MIYDKTSKENKKNTSHEKIVKAKNIIIESYNLFCCHEVMFKQGFLKVKFLCNLHVCIVNHNETYQLNIL